MIEKHIVLEDIDPVVFYGVGNAHLQMIKALYPKLRIVARDNVIRVIGDEEQMAVFEEQVETMRKHVLKYNRISEEDILDITKGQRTKEDAVKGVVVYNISGRPIKSRSENQQRLIDAFDTSDMIFAVGPAGTGKTYLSIALAVRALKEKQAKKIILSRPAVEAGEKLGFLPGDMKDKIDPYLQPLYDALEDMMPTTRLQDLMEKHVIQIAPLAFMRGRTLSDAVVILDEAQNTTPAQIRMFLTRMGWNTKMIIRSILTGSAWRDYKKGVREICGVKLPDGMRENERFPEPIITPTTKADEGHDMNISKEEIIAQGIVSREDYEVMEDYTRKIFARGQEIAAKQGLILVDTKYEFGKRDGKVYLIDEIHTPDSSRYFYADGYEEKFAKGEPQRQLSKEFVRQWLIEHNFMNEPGQVMPEITDEYANSVSDRYIELYEHIVGEKFNKSENNDDIAARIEKNVTEYLKNR